MVSRYRGGYAVRRSPRRWGISPHIGHQVVEIEDRLSFLASHPERCRSFRENGSHADLPFMRVPGLSGILTFRARVKHPMREHRDVEAVEHRQPDDLVGQVVD